MIQVAASPTANTTYKKHATTSYRYIIGYRTSQYEQRIEERGEWF